MTEITVELDDAREVMFDELVEMFSEEDVEETLSEQMTKHLTQMYDNREQLQQREDER